MEHEGAEGTILSTTRRGNYEYTIVRFNLTKAEADKLNKRITHQLGKISIVAPGENEGESLITFKKKVKHVRKELRD